MATFLTTAATSHQIELMIQRAEQCLFFVTPYLKLSQVLHERLKDADRRGVPITMVFGKEELSTAEVNKLAELENLSLRFLRNLHAKCYCDEHQLIIGSMNLHEFSQSNNREMAILLSPDGDPVAYAAGMREVQSILDASESRMLAQPTGKRDPRRTEKAAPAKAPERPPGACIRCASRMRYNPWTPLCDACYGSWAAWGNEAFPEKYCHRCGQGHQTTKGAPLCYSCYSQDPFQASASI